MNYETEGLKSPLNLPNITIPYLVKDLVNKNISLNLIRISIHRTKFSQSHSPSVLRQFRNLIKC